MVSVEVRAPFCILSILRRAEVQVRSQTDSTSQSSPAAATLPVGF